MQLLIQVEAIGDGDRTVETGTIQMTGGKETGGMQMAIEVHRRVEACSRWMVSLVLYRS